METDTTEPRKMPLEQLISAPMNAGMAAEASAAMTMLKFIEEVEFKRSAGTSFFDDPESSADDDYDVRVAKLRIDANGTRTNVDIPLITLVNVPNFEISNFDWSFNVKPHARISNVARGRNLTLIIGGRLPAYAGFTLKLPLPDAQQVAL